MKLKIVLFVRSKEISGVIIKQHGLVTLSISSLSGQNEIEVDEVDMLIYL